MKTLTLGDLRIDRCVESEGTSFFPSFLFPRFDECAFTREREDWLDHRYVDPGSGRLLMSLHTYVIRTPTLTILVDTCVGNDKERPDTPPWHRRSGPFLRDLTAMGIPPESVDVVLCTHLHVDHVGWNTRLEDGHWVPTFPNARYLFARAEYEHWLSAEGASGSGSTGREVFEDSVLPVVRSKQAQLVEPDHVIAQGMQLEPAPGHTPGHVFLNLSGGEQRAVFTGDCLHHPLQVAYPEWSSRFCVDPDLSARTRRHIVERCADRDVLVLGAHFPMPVAGRIRTNGNRHRHVFDDD